MDIVKFLFICHTRTNIQRVNMKRIYLNIPVPVISVIMIHCFLFLYYVKY